jgi:predicted NBD/HSP70 family sugar kinase
VSDFLIGIDLGGTKIEGVILHKETLKVLFRERIKTEAEKGYNHILYRIKYLVDLLSKKADISFDSLGIGTPGTLDPKLNVMKNCNSTVLNGKPFLSDLQQTLNMRVKMSNDANCFAIAETKLGIIKEEAPNIKNVFGVIMGTGVGGGVIIDGKILGGLQGIGGEWGHNILEHNGDKCYCGKNGCVEQVISGPALERYYQNISGEDKPLKQIVSAYRARNDRYADKTMLRLFTNFGKAISVVINILDPEAIIIGGGLGNIDELYTLGIDEVKKHVFNLRLDTQFFKPKLGDSAGVFGAALL